ncbi:MAG TPA: shikimate dehydrogenase [Miltoncostaeaceae bacterium]|nr:shikimate dehydrogenase [Miltoncostaeaceae bacterium]
MSAHPAPIDARTRIAGIIGWPVEHSLSPAMHNAAFAALDLNWRYVAFPVAPGRVAQALAGLAAAGVVGLNVTIPHKQDVIPCCSGVSEAVRAIGAANTLIADGHGGYLADNTDAEGFLRALDEQAPLSLTGEDVVIFGAGGAARALIFALRGRGARILVSNRTPGRADEIGADGEVPFAGPEREAAVRRAALVVNATSLGLHSDHIPSELPLESLRGGQVVADIVYRPGGTPWLAAARAHGARTVDGLGMLLHQGAAAFHRWTGREAPIEVMRAALLAAPARR